MSALSPENQAIQNYHDNIAYFEEHQPRLFKQLMDFETALDKGFYAEKYALEYKDEGYFDVKELESGKYFYDANSHKYADKVKKIVNFKKEESTFKTFYDFYFSDEELEAHAKNSIEDDPYHAYSKIMNLAKEAQSDNPQMKEIKKFIFFGVGLGTHIETVDAKIKAETYLIVEDDLELFRLSMFVTNYAVLAKSAKLFFSVFEEEEIARVIFDNFLEKSFYYNHYLKYFQMQSASDTNVKAMHTTITGQNHLIFLFSAYFKVYLRALNYLKNGYNFLDMSGKDIQEDTFDGKPIMIVAAGPSLSKNLDWLEKNRDRFVVVALSATLSVLEKHGIKPDIVTHLDPFEKTCMVHLDKLKDQDFVKDCLLFCGSQTPQILLDRFDKEKIFITQVNLTYKKSFDYIDPICVGSSTYMTLIKLGAREVYTLGLDLALDSQTGMSHNSEHAYNRALDTSKVDEVEDTLGYLTATVKIKGNFQEQMQATLTFNKSINAINNFTKAYKQEFQHIYNLNDGAYLEDFEPTRVADVAVDAFELLDKHALQATLLKALAKKSENEMSEEELDSMKRRHAYVKELIQKIEAHQYPKSFNAKMYQSQLLGLTLDILDEYDSEAWDLHNTYLSYLNFILPFVFDMLNTVSLHNEKRYIKKVHALLVGNALEIAKHYEKEIEGFFLEEVMG